MRPEVTITILGRKNRSDIRPLFPETSKKIRNFKNLNFHFYTVRTFASEAGKTCGLYYKHITIVNDDSSCINKCHLSLNDDARVIIYNCNMFIAQATTNGSLSNVQKRNQTQTV